MEGIKNKVAIVTGASRGIGKIIALALAREGAHIAVIGTKIETAQQTVKEIEALGSKSIACAIDISQSQMVNDMVKSVQEYFGRIDFLVNNAGITRDGLILRMKDEDWDDVIRVNLTGTFNCMRSVGKVLLKQRSGKVVTITSIIGQIGNIGQANYSASKAGLIGLTKSMAKEFSSRGITVNAVAPGYIATEMTEEMEDKARETLSSNIPLGKIGQPEDVANSVLFLLSDGAAYITGNVINVNGGLYM